MDPMGTRARQFFSRSINNVCSPRPQGIRTTEERHSMRQRPIARHKHRGAKHKLMRYSAKAR
jgi:hypothetical protein